MNVHDHLKNYSVDEIKEVYKASALPFSVACLNVTKDLNVGMIVRTAAVFGAQQFYILGRRKYDKRTTVGTQNYIPVDRVDCMKGEEFDAGYALDYIRLTTTHTIICVETEKEGSVDIGDVDFSIIHNPLLVFGNEGDGIPQVFLDGCDIHTHIPMRGVTRSLNVSNSASIAIYEAYRSLS